MAIVWEGYEWGEFREPISKSGGGVLTVGVQHEAVVMLVNSFRNVRVIKGLV